MNAQISKGLPVQLRQATVDDISKLDRFAEQNGIAKTALYYDLQIEAQSAGSREVWLCEDNEGIVSYCVLNWQPKYAYFKTHGWPEIQDLNTAKAHRKKGYASALIEKCESLARDKSLEHMGIGVGMDASFGPAQRLYIKLGYVPDGNGITYDRQQVGVGEFRPVDGELCLMMVKAL